MADTSSPESAEFDFFISHTAADKPSAEWIAWVLEAAGYTTIVQEWDFRPGNNFADLMDSALRTCKRTLAVLSESYLKSDFARSEWLAAFRSDPTGRSGTLVPVRVADVELKGLLASIVYVDLVGLEEQAAQEALLRGVLSGSVQPSRAPSFPLTARNHPTGHASPPFPLLPTATALAAGVATGGVAQTAFDQPEETQSRVLRIRFRHIPAGTFLMGSSNEDTDAFLRERPQHSVTISEPFLLSVFPVTRREYRQVMGTNPSQFNRSLSCPVVEVDWFDAIDFCNRLSELEGRTPYYVRRDDEVSIRGGDGYRLPTEAQWEYACRAGSTEKYGFGSNAALLGDYAWFGSNSGRRTHPVGQKKPNAWGLYDMHGNVWEWCWDWLGDYQEVSVKNPQRPANGPVRVYRGGSWDDAAQDCRSAYRGRGGPAFRYDHLGFRVATVESDKPAAS